MLHEYYTCVVLCLVMLSCHRPRTVASQAPLSMGFSRQGYWSGLSFPSPGDHPDPGIEPTSLASPVLAGGFSTTREALQILLQDSNESTALVMCQSSSTPRTLHEEA